MNSASRVVPFPHPARPVQRYRTTDETIIAFPFSQAECDVITAHLRERSPELSADIADSAMRDVIERWLTHLWRDTGLTWWFLLPTAILHIHAFWTFGPAISWLQGHA